MIITRRALGFSALALPGLTLTAPASIARAQAFPTRPIRVVIGYPPGGGVDNAARPVMQRLAERLGQPVVVENRAGANGNIAMEHAARVEPDGHTLFMGDTGNLGITHALYPNLAFDTQRDFAAVAQLASGPSVLAIATSVPAANHAEFVALAKARPGALNCGSAGIGSAPHLYYETWRRAAGVELTHVPYRGMGPALAGLLAGDVQLIIGNYGIFRGAHEAGRVRVIGISSESRHPSLPDVPTVTEQGVGWVAMGFMGVIAPARIPPERRQMLEDSFKAVMAEPAIMAQMLAFATASSFAPGAALDARMRTQRADWTRLVREANIQVE